MMERGGVKEVIAAVGEGKFEMVLLTKPKEYVEKSTAGCFVRFQEHHVHFGRARPLH